MVEQEGPVRVLAMWQSREQQVLRRHSQSVGVQMGVAAVARVSGSSSNTRRSSGVL
jgi:hypothetical protein